MERSKRQSSGSPQGEYEGINNVLKDYQKKANMPVQARETFIRSADLARKHQSPEQLARAALGFGIRFTGVNPEKVDQYQIDLIQEALKAFGTTRWNADLVAAAISAEARVSVAASEC